ncbi:acetolactate synthase, large subunit [Clostridium cavendishii DSM 21758]|uniref:Acetolactate synthase n=1 Tax=Clostridium cavendishii DSM 21758 TaxID=1121302 RepID=A0A1M6B8A4_9CLOT|nr:biosynthetic-type acetolactate synthase large subunit [Clostridium cavendishii]SHI44969.1 acetolactate synthase, large subunit [Clostridium cavendishii DSM 21758]
MLLNGAEILINCLLEQGVDTIFGYPGGAVLNIYDALYKYQDKITHVLTCHEQGAAHAADGYARSSGKVGVCLATSGPGATNLVTGIATAYMDSIPLVAITGNVTMPLLGKDSFQEVDISGITMPITKHNYMVKDINKLPDIIREAFYIAKEGRPGPVLIDIPKDITGQTAIYEHQEPVEPKRKNKYITREALEKVAKLINQSERPFIFAGGGVIASSSENELKQLVNKINAPITTSLMGIGAYDSNDNLYTGMIGMHGTKASNLLATKCDLLIAIGTRFSDRVLSDREHIENAKIVHIDVDPAEINKNIKVDSYIIGDIKLVLSKLIPLINEKNNLEWLDTMSFLKKQKAIVDRQEEALTPQFLFQKLNEITNGNLIMTTDVGQHQMWAALYYNFKYPRTYISSGGLGTMGYGLGAAIGSQFANKDKLVVDISGDGSFGMNCNELATIVSNKLPIVIIVMNNNSLGMVRQWQNFFYEERYSHTTLNRETNFVKLAEAYGLKGYRVEYKEELDGVLREAIGCKRPVLIDYIINEDKKVFPMVAPGEPISKVICEKDIMELASANVSE